MERNWRSVFPDLLRKLITGLSVALLVSCGVDLNGDFEVALPRGYVIFASSSHNVAIFNSDGQFPEVPAKVVAVGWDNQFVLAKQQLLKNRSDFPGDSFQIPDPGKYQFWIIDLVNTNRLGPLDENMFSAERKALGVPDTIKMKPPSAYAK